MTDSPDEDSVVHLETFEDVQKAREMRMRIINGETLSGSLCPICAHMVGVHASALRRPNGEWVGLPCWRRGEWDKYSLHVAPTRVREDEVWLIP